MRRALYAVSLCMQAPIYCTQTDSTGNAADWGINLEKLVCKGPNGLTGLGRYRSHETEHRELDSRLLERVHH